MHQLPVRAKSQDPANLGTADCSLICHCDDGSDYAVKDISSGPDVMHSEWFCKHLGDFVGIASPECRLVEVNGEIAFGSRWESGHEPDNWWKRVKSGDIDAGRVAPTFSRIFAFDLFVNNEDRHAENYIVRPQANDQWSLLAFDHSRAWRATGWPLAKAPMQYRHTTTTNFKAINTLLGGIFLKDEFMFVINAIRDCSVDCVEKILTSQPESWLSKPDCDAICSFWKSRDFWERLDKIEEGLNNGSYV